MVKAHNMKPKGKFREWARRMDAGNPTLDYSKEDFWYNSGYKRTSGQISSIKLILSGKYRPHYCLGFNKQDTPQGFSYWEAKQNNGGPFSQKDLAYLQYLLDNH